MTAGLLLALAGCEINSPEMPSFDTQLVLPLGSERLEVRDAVDNEEYLLINPDGSLEFSVVGDPDTLALDFDLHVDTPAQSVDQGLGEFSLPASAPLNFAFQLGDIWAPAGGANNLTTIVPGFPINVSSAGQGIPDLTSAALSEGRLAVKVTNNLVVPIGADSGGDQLILDLEDAGDGSLIAQIAFPVIAAGATSTQHADLAGANLPPLVSVRLQGGSTGSSGQPVTINGADNIAIAATFTDLLVSSATAVVTGQNFNTSVTMPLPAEYEITRATIASGHMGLEMSNNLPLPCTVIMAWDQVRNIDGAAMTSTFDLAAGATVVTSLEFANHIVQADGAPLSGLMATVDIYTPGSGGSPVTLAAADGLSASLSAGNLVFGSVTGVVPAFAIALEPVTEEIDLPDEMSGLELTAASLSLELTNSAAIPADLDFVLTGTAASGSVRTLNVVRQIRPAEGRAATTTTIILNQSNSTILEFLNNLPRTITLSGDVTAGGSGSSGTVHADDYAVINWQIAAPVEIEVTGAVIDGDPDPLDIDADLRERISTHARGAVLRTQISNHLPLAVQLRVVAAQDSNGLDTNPLLDVGPVAVAAALIDPASHVASQAVTSTPVITLTEAEARIFGQPGLLTRVQVILPSTNGQPVRVLASDYVEFQGVVELEVRVDDEL